jgi:hypothetical protein
MKQFLVNSSLITLRLDGEDIAKLDRAAKASGRGNRSNVLRQLITLIDTQAGHAALGIVDKPQSVDEWQREV